MVGLRCGIVSGKVGLSGFETQPEGTAERQKVGARRRCGKLCGFMLRMMATPRCAVWRWNFVRALGRCEFQSDPNCSICPETRHSGDFNRHPCLKRIPLESTQLRYLLFTTLPIFLASANIDNRDIIVSYYFIPIIHCLLVHVPTFSPKSS